MTEKVVRVVVSGKVQGVWFRAWTCQTAERLGLRGWVRNRRDETVEAVFAGAESDVDRMIKACHDGPLHARVVDVAVSDWSEEVPSGFLKRETV